MALAWTNLPLRAKGFVVASLPVTALLLCLILVLQVQNEQNDAEAGVKRTLDGRSEIRNVNIALLSAESAVRYFALSGDTEALRAYEAAGRAVDASLERSKDLVGDDPEQLERLRHLGILVHQRLEALGELRTFYEPLQSRSLPAPEDLLRQSKTAMDQTLAQVRDAYDAQNRRLEDRVSRNKDRETRLEAVMAATAAVGLLGGILAMVLFIRGMVRRVRQLEHSADLLEKGLPPESGPDGTDELGRLGNALCRTGTKPAGQSEELELALESAQFVFWELEPQTGRIRYQAGSAEPSDVTTHAPQMMPETVDKWIAAVHAEDRIDVQQELNRILAEGGSFRIEYRLAPRGGETRWMGVKGKYHPSSDGKPPRLLGVQVDITERKKATEELERQTHELEKSKEARQAQTRILQLILDSMGDAVAVADQDGKFLVFNPAAERILERGEFYGDPGKWSENYGVFLPDMVSLYPAENLPLARAIRGESVDAEEVFLRPSGDAEGKWVSVTARPLKDEDGNLHGGVVVFREVSEAKRAGEALRLAKQEAENANNAKSEFLSRMSHELRTPLNSILGFAQLLELADLNDQQSDNVQHILKGGYHLLELINEVLDLARIESGRLSLSPEPVRMREALKDAVELIRPLAVQQIVEISPEVAIRCDRHVRADRQRLKQVLLNLLSNAVKFNRNGGSVVLSCEETPENRLRIEVTDTGRGIAADKLDKLFKPFERLGADSTGVEGTGLGLALTKRLVEAMGGTIGVDSTIGLGSRFFIELALLEDPADQLEVDREAALATSGSDPGAHRGTVLYIEDNLSNLRLMERIMAHRPGVTLLSAMQAQLGLDLAQTHTPDWILLDLHLPDLPGEEVLRRLREDPRTEQIPVTVVSADATPGQIDRLMAAGARNYLTKPLDVRKLLRLLEKTMLRGESDSREAAGSYGPGNHSE